ncbi:hypothetical protein OHC33_005618 [Knufia fluminis]|uniref:3-hydroxyisobutyrate dehydrogenase n=2 Tax=Knufia TaxID=430999 RepID=A0AAN8EFP7_9EURO|nr:hypothetical protein OHC33_005618 [Knufia fluminis]
MGYGMAVNLRSKVGKETTLVVCDVNQEAIDRFKAENSDHGPIEVAKNGFEAVQKANTLFTVMPSSDAVKSVYLNPDTGVLAGAGASTGQQKLLIECGTIPQSMIKEVAEASRKIEGVDFIDAPISGGPIGSKEGTLSFMVGAPKGLFERVRPLLVHMGKPESIFHCGDVGTGSAFKIINNYISLISVLSVSEAYNIASRMNLDLNVLTDLFNTSSAQCWVTSKNNPVPGITPNSAASRGYEGGFRLELAHKDLSLGRELAEMVGARRDLHEVALKVYEEAKADPRYAGKDARVLYKFLNEN